MAAPPAAAPPSLSADDLAELLDCARYGEVEELGAVIRAAGITIE